MQRTPEQILEEFLVLQAQNGNRESIEKLFDRWQTRFVHYAFQITNDRHLAADVVQEAWLSILKSLRKLRDPEHFRSWAYRIVHHKACDQVRANVKARAEQASLANTTATGLANAEPDWDPAGDEDQEDLQQLRGAIAALKPEDRQVVALFYHENMTLNEIHEITGDSISAIKSRLHHVRQRLRKSIERNRK